MSTSAADLGDGTRTGDVDLAALGAVLADGSRCGILLALLDGRALPASRLAAEAGVSPATASAHLARLLETQLLAVEQHGRHRYYRLAGPEVGRLLETMTAFAPRQPVRSMRQGTRAAALREARSCYDHLAGRLGVTLMGALLEHGHVTGGDGRHDPEGEDPRAGHGHSVDYRLADSGLDLMSGLDVVVQSGPLAYCVDWTEQRHHLGGALGRALLARLLERGWLRRRTPAHRALVVTDAGRTHLPEVFGVPAL